MVAHWSSLLVLLVSLTAAAPDTRPRARLQTDQLQLCGKDLADVLSYVCQPYGGINGPSSQAAPLKSETGRPMGIVDECCRRSCRLSTLLSYCANYTSTEQQGELEEELNNRVIEMLFGPPVPRRPRRFGKTGGCARRCRLNCGKHATLQLRNPSDAAGKRPVFFWGFQNSNDDISVAIAVFTLILYWDYGQNVSAKDEAALEGNKRANDIQSIGTVPPPLQRRPVVVYPHRY